ncbi:quinon protein alcohol dehydrogenase-like superfamily [Phascolomyces articulosus]|uniref:Quinon protein alcohol dehydrogenase-like superfamily n=1 Tax=Phascolomyces articulosus TaxID=60185 RepID=A0AAD5PJG2_9FUNG|nr:quinon protein alcohol dehydrogenase-like superfamily [Phascolomyces articulosus]
MTDKDEPLQQHQHQQHQKPDVHHSFLSRHVPAQYSNTRKLCYRHRPDLTRKRMPDSFNFEDVQRQMESLPTPDRAAISRIWSLFSAAPADQRTLILKGLLSTCCMPQLSFLYDEIKPLLRIDFSSILPREVALRIFSFLDAKSLCHAAQVSQSWRSLADDDQLWHRMCEQHIDKKCTKCGWGLPLLDKGRRKRSPDQALLTAPPATIAAEEDDKNTNSPLRTACGPGALAAAGADQDDLHRTKRVKMDNNSTTVESFEGGPYPATNTEVVPVRTRRPWKEVYSERLVVERNWRRNKYNVRVLRGHTDGVMCVQFCDANNILITGSYDKTVKVWSLDTGETIRTLEGHTRCVRALQFDNAKLVTGSMDHTLKIWDWHAGRCIRTLEGHTGGVLSLHFDSKLLASGSTDMTIRVWDFQRGECCTLMGHTEWVNSVRICSQDNLLVSGSDDSTIRLWDLQTRSCVKVFNGHVGQVQIALPSPRGFKHRFNGELIDHTNNNNNHVSSNSNNTASPQPMNLTNFQPACATEDRTSATRRHHRQLQQSSSDDCSTQGALSDTPIILSGSLDNTLKFWTFDGVCLRTLFGHVEGVWSIAFDSLRIVSGSHDRTVRVWDLENGHCMHALEGHSGPVTAVAMSDTKIISASEDSEVRIWDFSANQ